MLRLWIWIPLTFAACLLGVPSGLRPVLGQAAQEPLSFNRDIRAILADNCFACHGQDAKKREADLRLDTFEGATGEDGGPQAIVPGDPDSSELLRRVTTDDEDELMPPPSSHKTLTDAQKDLLKRWIRARCRVSEALVVRADSASSRAAGTGRKASCRRVSGGALATGRLDAAAGSRPGNVDSPRGAGGDRPAADGGGSGSVPGGRGTGRLRTDGRSLSGFAALRRGDGQSLAGRRAVCRYARTAPG